jgi:hypothetical protein
MGKLLKITALLVLVPAVLFAGAETGADILKERTGVRATAMGGAYTAAANDVEALNYNPAGIASLIKKEAEFFTFLSPLNYADATILYLAFAQPFESPLLDGFLGISAVYRGVPDIANDDAVDDPSTPDYNEADPVAYYDMALTGSYACSLYQFFKDDFFKSLSFGLSAKLIFEQIGPHRGSTFAFDAGFIYAPADMGLKFGIALMNGPSYENYPRSCRNRRPGADRVPAAHDLKGGTGIQPCNRQK